MRAPDRVAITDSLPSPDSGRDRLLSESPDERRAALNSASFGPQHRELLGRLVSADPDENVRRVAAERLIEANYAADRLESWHHADPLSDYISRTLREYTRRREFSASPPALANGRFARLEFSEERAVAARMLAFEPLVALGADERALVRYAVRGAARGVIRSALSKLREFYDAEHPPTLRGHAYEGSAVEAITDPRLYAELHGRHGSLLVHYGSRDLDGYRRECGIVPERLTADALARGAAPARVLDVGCCVAQAMYELKKSDVGDRIETHGVSLEGAPHYPCDQFYFLSADHLPANFARRFDVIVSSRCLEYVLLAHRALEGIAEALAPGGVAQLQWRPGRGADDDSEYPERTRRQLLRVLPESVSEPVIALLDEGLALFRSDGMFAEMAKFKRQRVHEYLDTKDDDSIMLRQTLAWAESVQKLRARADLDVKIQCWTMTMFGGLPGNLLVTRRH